MYSDNIIISKPDYVIRTYNKTDTKLVMKDRYASAVIIVLCGRAEFVFEDNSKILCGGDAIFIPEGKSYNIICYEDTESLVINFHTVSNSLPETRLKTIDIKTAEVIFEELNLLLQKPNDNRNGIFSTYYNLLSALFDNKAKLSNSETYVKNAENIIYKNFQYQNLNCNSVASRLNISEVYLRKLFKRYRNMPVSDFLLKVRMIHAQRLILEGSSVSAAAVSSGYSDIYQFSRAYKKYFGFSPTKKA